jgi:hypothetical protein
LTTGQADFFRAQTVSRLVQAIELFGNQVGLKVVLPLAEIPLGAHAAGGYLRRRRVRENNK